MLDEAARMGLPRRDLPRAASRLGRRACAALVALLAGSATADPGNDALALVQRVYYEGVPFAAARAVDASGSARLAAMLRDPAERTWWPNAALVLGIAGQVGAYEALVAADQAGSSGEVDRTDYKLRTAIPLAMGHLARSDPRALSWLIARARDPAEDPGWSFRALRGPPLAAHLRGLAIEGLGLSGRPEARAVLEVIAGEESATRSLAPTERVAHAAEALRLQARIAAEGADAVLGARVPE
jgi:hypothetical protein